ncbi:hypothetical protein DIPPA_13516 [Diplonema papillatum]|nr:hypothetical protein DIPPA_13516 [Diplonema papillatum]
MREDRDAVFRLVVVKSATENLGIEITGRLLVRSIDATGPVGRALAAKKTDPTTAEGVIGAILSKINATDIRSPTDLIEHTLGKTEILTEFRTPAHDQSTKDPSCGRLALPTSPAATLKLVLTRPSDFLPMDFHRNAQLSTDLSRMAVDIRDAPDRSQFLSSVRKRVRGGEWERNVTSTPVS